MRRTVGLVVAWILAGVGAVVLASVAVGAVGDQLTGDRPAALSAAQVRTELDQASTTTTSSAPPGTSPTAGPGPAGAGTSGDDRGTSREPGDDTSRGVTTTTAPPRSSTASTAPATTTKTFVLVGGTATLRFGPSGVTVVTATPSAGFSVDAEPDHGNGIRVDFESANHESRLSGWWDGGPRSETREESHGGGDDGGGSSGPG